MHVQSNLQNTASTINTSVQEIPLVATFEVWRLLYPQH